MKITKRTLAVIIAATLVVAGTVFFVIRAFSSDKQTVLAPTRAEAQTQQAQIQVQVTEPKIVEETTEFSVVETTTPAPTAKAAAKAATKTTTAPAEFVEVSEIAVFSQQDLVVNEAPVVEETTEEETTGYEPVYNDPLPPEGYDWIE
ncbi:MAG: hypothetical protein ACI37Z_05155 [Candidatus Gastranaerophilaceae bacterium]